MESPGEHTTLTAVILTLNEEAHIQECIASLAWVDRVLVFDSFSTDKTALLAEAAGADVLYSRFEDYAQQRNAALEAVSTDWLFFVDADERGTPALGEEIRQVVAQLPEAGWYVPRLNYLFGKLTRCAGWYPDHQLRLFRQGHVRYRRAVHEIADVDGTIGYLQEPLIHYNYRDVAQFRRKQEQYSAFEAEILLQAGVRPRPYTYLTMPLRQFWWRFVTLNGYQAGAHGLRLSAYMAYYEWVKYRKLGRAWKASAGGVTQAPYS